MRNASARTPCGDTAKEDGYCVGAAAVGAPVSGSASLRQLPWPAAWYCSATLAGMRPRSLTASPCSFAQPGSHPNAADWPRPHRPGGPVPARSCGRAPHRARRSAATGPPLTSTVCPDDRGIEADLGLVQAEAILVELDALLGWPAEPAAWISQDSDTTCPWGSSSSGRSARRWRGGASSR